MMIVKCNYCSKGIKRKPSDIKRYKHHFCDNKCYHAWINETGFKPSPSPELSYLLGVRYGDGCIETPKNNRCPSIVLVAKDKDFVKEFRRCGCKLLEKERKSDIWIRGDGYYYWKIYSKKLCESLSRPLDYHKPFIEKHPADFLRGFYDSEGYVLSYPDKRSNGRIVNIKLGVSNTNRELIFYVRRLLGKLGIDVMHSKDSKRRVAIYNGKKIISKKPIHILATHKKDNLRQFKKKIGFTIERKQKKLVEILNHKTIPLPKACKMCKVEFVPKSPYEKYCTRCKEEWGYELKHCRWKNPLTSRWENITVGSLISYVGGD